MSPVDPPDKVQPDTEGFKNILVETRSVGVLVLLDDGDDQGDEFGPEVQVLDAGPLLLRGHHPLLGLGGGHRAKNIRVH